MDFSEKAALQEIVDHIDAHGANEHMIPVLKALKLVEYGYASFQDSKPGGSISFRQQLLKDLAPIAHAELIRALVQQSLLVDYAQAGRFHEALEIGLVALPVLAKDSRMAYAYAHCLHDLGVTVLQMGDETKGIKFMEQALAIYDNLPDRARGEACRTNLARLRTAQAKGKESRSIFSRLFGRS